MNKDQTGQDDYETYVGGRRYDPDERNMNGTLRALDRVKARREAERKGLRSGSEGPPKTFKKF